VPYTKLEILRKKLNNMIISEDVDRKDLQQISEEVDVEVVRFMKNTLNKQKPNTNDISMEDVEEYLKNIQLFKKMYDTLRIVDPINKVVLKLTDGKLYKYEIICHHFWKRNQACDNCISSIAYQQNDTIFKLEVIDNEVYMVTAVPIIIREKRLVLEMIKNTTESLYFSGQKVCNKKLNLIIPFLTECANQIKVN